MSDFVAVALRVRPLVKSELERGCRISVQRTAGDVPQVTVNGSDCFTYNYVFDSKDAQQDIYKACVQEKLKKLLQGYNVTILAYGQTGSGKTYTMGTAFDGIMDDNVGVIPRAVHEIFKKTAAMEEEYQFKITCSFVELYQEQFYDLFSTNKREDSTVDIREDRNRIIMPGLTEVEVKQAKQVTDQLMRGSAGRAVASTAMNETSSRSHAIFTITVVATKKTGQKSVSTSKFNLVDLAGSERCSKTLACGDRFKEGVNINKGLLALGNVINVLGSGQPTSYVPYRQSKLTRLLQDSLGGNSITLMIACVSPADYNVCETLSTLRYADRALQIKNKPVVNVDPHAAELKALNDIIQKLRIELLVASGGSTANVGGIGTSILNGISGMSDGQRGRSCEKIQQLQEANARTEKKNRRMQQELNQALIDLAELEMRAHMVEVTHDKLKVLVLDLKQKLISKTKEEDQQLLLREITQLVTRVDEELQQTETALQTHRKECLNGSAVTNGNEDSHSGSEESQNQLFSRTEEHTTKQLNLNGELRNINRELNIKQELHDRVASNFSKLKDEDTDEKYKQCEQKIEQLEVERGELLNQLRNTKHKDTSAKLAEERRKRLQLLEQEIIDMRRKIVQQANMLKMREKEREKIQNLCVEIRAMKESKVKLIRAMRGESEKFRQWKIVNEKELTQLKSKDRKMQSEMVRKENLHAKQRQVLKRKCEEALATNKRLKDALERQRVAQAQRQKHAKDQPGGGKLDALVDRELEVILSLIDAEHSLEQLMEDRAIITAHCTELKEQQQQAQGSVSGTEQTQLLASLEEELEMRNAQIADLQQKVCSEDLEARMQGLYDSVHSIAESRIVNKQLLKNFVQQRREQTQGMMDQKVLVDEQRSQLNEVQQEKNELAKRLRQAEIKHEQQMASQQRSYEEKVAVLLRSSFDALSANDAQRQPEDLERQRIVEELLTSKEALQQELDQIKSKTNAKKKKLPFIDPIIVDLDDSQLSENFIESDSDPEWVPNRKRSKKSHSTSIEQASLVDKDHANSSSNNKNILNNHNNNTTIDSSLALDDTRKAGHRCKCRTNCNSKRCGCFALGNSCGSNCTCKMCCQNPYKDDKENSRPVSSPNISDSNISHNQSPKTNNTINEADENVVDENETVAAEAHLKSPELSSGSLGPLLNSNPLVTRHSQLNFHNTPSSKKKFFNRNPPLK